MINHNTGQVYLVISIPNRIVVARLANEVQSDSMSCEWRLHQGIYDAG